MIRNKPTGRTKRPLPFFLPTVLLHQLKTKIPILDRKQEPKFKLKKTNLRNTKTKGKIVSKMNPKKNVEVEFG